MTLANPWYLLAGLLAAAVPLVIHFLYKKRARLQRLPTLEFLMDAQSQKSGMRKIRKWLLLAVRVLVLALLATAFAQPYSPTDEQGNTLAGQGPETTVVVLDTSASMQTSNWWNRAKDEVRAVLDNARPWDEIGLVTTTGGGETMTPTESHGDIRNELTDRSPAFQRGRMDEAISAASRMLSKSSRARRRLVLVSDLSRHELGAKFNASQFPIELRSVRQTDNTPENLSIGKLEYRVDKDGTVVLNASVRRSTSDMEGPFDIFLVINGRRVASGKLTFDSKSKVSYSFQHRMIEPGLKEGYVEVRTPDAFRADNQSFFSFYKREQIDVLLVNGEPSGVSFNDELYFLSRALDSGKRADDISYQTTSGIDFQNRSLEGVDVVVLANVSAVEGGAARKLEQFVRTGGGLLVAAGDQIEASSYNEHLGALMPRPLRGHRVAAHDGETGSTRALNFGTRQKGHWLFEPFERPGGASLNSAKVSEFMLLEPDQGDSGQNVLMSYDNGAPALVQSKVGAGKALLWTTSIDTEWTDLPVQTSYLPFVIRTVKYLADQVGTSQITDAVAGRSVQFSGAKFEGQRMIIRGRMPAKIRDKFGASYSETEPVRDVITPGESFSYTPKFPGSYQLWQKTDSAYDSWLEARRQQRELPEVSHRIDDWSFAVNLPNRETKLAPASAKKWRKALGVGPNRSRKLAGAGNEASDSATSEIELATHEGRLWPYFLFGVLALLLLETGLELRRRFF